jgi:ATP-binding cassette subfamily C protein CydC
VRTGADFVRGLVRDQVRAQGGSLLAAAAAATAVSIAAAALLGVSGWFLTGAAIAGLAGPALAITFNFLLPSAVIRLLAILRTALRYVERLSSHHGALEALADIRPRLFERMAAGGLEGLIGRASGEVAARLGQDVDALQTAFVRRSAPWGAIGGIGAGVVLAAFAGWIQALITGLAVLAALAVARLMGRHLARGPGRAVQHALGALKSEVSGLEQAAPELVAYGAHDWALARAASRGDALYQAQTRLASAGGWIIAAHFAVMAAAVAMLLAVAPGADAALTALAVLGTISAIESAGAFADAERQRGGADAAIARLGALTEGTASPTATRPSPVLRIRGLDADLSPGDRIAILGRSGSGKTTLIERLIGLRSAQPGDASFGGLEACDLPETARRCLFAYAPQETRFISGTLRQNLSLAAPQPSDADLWRALEDVGLADRFRQGRGLETPLSDDARGLSGGERRRLTLARAYLRPAPWLVLDEPTEALDAMAEAHVIAALERRLATTGQGLILISHRAPVLALAVCSISMDAERGLAPGATRPLQLESR